MKSILFASVIGLAVALTTPALAHVPSQCHKHLREFSKLQAEKFAMMKQVVTKDLGQIELKRDGVVKEIRYILEGVSEDLPVNDYEDLSSEYLKVFVFDGQKSTPALTKWMECLNKFGDVLPLGYEDLPTLREWIDSR